MHFHVLWCGFGAFSTVLSILWQFAKKSEISWTFSFLCKNNIGWTLFSVHSNKTSILNGERGFLRVNRLYRKSDTCGTLDYIILVGLTESTNQMLRKKTNHWLLRLLVPVGSPIIVSRRWRFPIMAANQDPVSYSTGSCPKCISASAAQ